MKSQNKERRQGCVVSARMFNLYIEEAIKEFKDKIDTGQNILARLRFADDIPIIGGNKNELENAINGINPILEDGIKMKINKNKKVLFCTKKNKHDRNVWKYAEKT